MSVFNLLPGVVGDAEFSADGKHRLWLERRLATASPEEPFALFIGCNPSKAGAECDDPTVRREWLMVLQRLKLRRYIKVNVMTMIATDPRGLIETQPWELVAPGNWTLISGFCEGATVSVACWGTLHPSLRKYVRQAMSGVHMADPHRMICLGKTADGSPLHGRGVRKDAPLCTFP